MIKIDVEGAEALVFEGMKEILSKNQSIKIFLEFFPLLIEKMGSSPEDFAKYLLKNFSVYVIGHDYSMKKFNSEIMKIENYEEINCLLKEKIDHVNLYLTKNSNIL